MAIQNNLTAPIVATSAADALKQYDEAKKAKKSTPATSVEKLNKAKKLNKTKKVASTPVKKKAPAKKAAKKAKVKKVKRTFNAAVTGTTLKSRMVRISTELADFLAGEAAKSDITVTEASRILVEGLLK